MVEESDVGCGRWPGLVDIGDLQVPKLFHNFQKCSFGRMEGKVSDDDTTALERGLYVHDRCTVAKLDSTLIEGPGIGI